MNNSGLITALLFACLALGIVAVGHLLSKDSARETHEICLTPKEGDTLVIRDTEMYLIRITVFDINNVPEENSQ